MEVKRVRIKHWFNTKQRIRQEFMIFLDCLKYWWINLQWMLVVTQAAASMEGLTSTHENLVFLVKTEGCCRELQMYMQMTTLLADTLNDLQWILARLYNVKGNMDLKINVDQHSYNWHIKWSNNCKLFKYMKEKKLEQVDEFVYFGRMFSKDGEMETF